MKYNLHVILQHVQLSSVFSQQLTILFNNSCGENFI